MKKEKQQAGSDPAPKGADIEKMDVWLRVEVKRSLEALALKEGRSGTKQAAYFIEMGMKGVNLTELAQKMERMDAKLDAILNEIRRG